MSNAAVAMLSQFGDFDPVLMAPDQSARVTSCLRALGDLAAKEPLLTMPKEYAGTEDFWPDPTSPDAYYRPYIVKDNILQIPVKGVLLHGFTYAVGSYATGYDYITQALKRGLADHTVVGIALMCDTPGGHVAGCFELADKIYAARNIKPIQAFAYESAYSAGYALASSADKIDMSRTGGVGSIGVVTMHVSYEKALEKEGIEVTFIFAGKHKVDGNPYEALSDDAKARIQKRIDETYVVFTSTVARNRAIPEISVRRTEALTYSGADALTVRLVDNVRPLDEAFAEFADNVFGYGDRVMTAAANAPVKGATFTQEQVDQAVAAAKGENATAVTAAATAVKQRIAAIKGLDEAKTRPVAAETLAMDTDLTVEQSKAVLAKMPEEPKPGAVTTNSGDSAFTKQMEAADKGPGAEAEDKNKALTPEQKDEAATARILHARFGDKKAS